MSANIWRSGILIVEAYLTEISQRSRFDVGFPILHSDQLRRKRRQEDFRPSRSGGPIFRAGDQNIRVVVPDAVGPGADGTPFVGSATGFTHQLEAPRHWRRRIEPVGKPVGDNDRRLSMVDVGKPSCHPYAKPAVPQLRGSIEIIQGGKGFQRKAWQERPQLNGQHPRRLRGR